jgi:hypothetical protein
VQELLADPWVKEQSRNWPDCSQGGERAENLLFYEDPDYKFVINGLIKAPHTRRKFTITRTTGRFTVYSMAPRRSSDTSASMTAAGQTTQKSVRQST